jgi:hypothetical protein
MGTVASGPKVPLAGSNVEPLPVQTAARSPQSNQSWHRRWRSGTLVEDAGLSGRQMQQCPPALEVATRVAADHRQGAVPLEFASVEEAAVYRDRLRSALTERAAAGDVAMGHVRPWVWTPASTGRALTEAGNRTGVEVRLSYYR